MCFALLVFFPLLIAVEFTCTQITAFFIFFFHFDVWGRMNKGAGFALGATSRGKEFTLHCFFTWVFLLVSILAFVTTRGIDILVPLGMLERTFRVTMA